MPPIQHQVLSIDSTAATEDECVIRSCLNFINCLPNVTKQQTIAFINTQSNCVHIISFNSFHHF